MKRVVVTGLGAITPIGNTVNDFLSSLQVGKSGANLITKFDATNFKTRFACEIKDFNADEFMPARDARRLDEFSIYGIVASDEAIADAGLKIDQLELDRVGVIWASGIGGLRTVESEIEEFIQGDGTPRYSPFLIPKMISDIVAGHISIKYGFMGANFATVSACASSSHSIMSAFDYIRMGRNDIVITGGSEASVVKSAIGGFSSMKALSTRNEDYQHASRPFDRDRDGFVMGEGAACLVLEELEHARKRGAKIYAEVVGTGATGDAHHITAPHPDGLGAQKAMQLALKESGLDITDIDYINVHGTSTPLGDVAELKAIQKVFGDAVYGLNISSTKSMTGHLLGAAGAVEALACVLALEHQFIPPTINHVTHDPEIDPKLNLTLNQAQQRNVRAVLSNTFGFGGHNATIILKKLQD
ncbi:MAG TPA: beta-ketoacyl-ACP synthase II [Saprospiraceae bacterium]|nr:beta-ketoacyl-ACP synthase II [Saprospiraceae bacterium]HMQ81717.1 beta-ketoacyl-ACP synthase II [Saprospiraceae bacterium]